MPDRQTLPALRSVLIIEDSRLDYIATRGMLLGGQSGAAQLEWLQTWPGAAAALARGSFDLFLVDLHLDHVSGLDIIRELRGAGVLAPIIALTGAANEDIDRACTEAGASDFLVKGEFDSADLDRSIRYGLRHAAVHRELDRVNAMLERRASAEADQARLMRFAIEQSADPIFISTAAPLLSGQFVVYANAALCAVLARRGGALLGADVASLLASSGEAEAQAMERVLATGQGHAARLPLKAASGTLQASVRVFPLRGQTDQVTHFVWTCHKADGEVRHLEGEQRQQKLQAMGELASGVAHDFNNLLTAVLGNLELLERGLAEPRQQKLVQGAARAAERGARLAHQLLIFAGHGGGGKASISPEKVVEDLHDLLARSLGGLIRLDHVPGGACWPVLIDLEQFELALLNLAIHAREAMKSGGVLQIVCRNLPADDEDRPAALDPATDYVELSLGGALSAPASPAPLGDSAGLAQLRAAMREANGVVHVDGGEDRTLRLFIPRDTQAAPKPQRAEAPPARSVRLVLAAGADSARRDFMALSLRRLGCRVLEAATGRQAIELFDSARIEALVTDMTLPDLPGAMLARHLRGNAPDLPVVFVSSEPDPPVLDSDLANCAILQNPLKTARLAQALGLEGGDLVLLDDQGGRPPAS